MTCHLLLTIGFALLPGLDAFAGPEEDSSFGGFVPDQGGLLYFVNTTSDTVVIGACANGNAGCSLRGAIQTANSHSGIDEIEIALPAGSIINLTQALPDLTESVAITGPGADLLTVRRNTGGSYRIFNVTTSGPVSFTGLTITNGLTTGRGGGINKGSGTVNVVNCVLSSNGASRGGGIHSDGGTLNVIRSALVGNTANDSGGGISNRFGTANVTNSTLTGNLANEFGTGDGSGGGGICNGDFLAAIGGILNVTNSTITGNSAFHGGGISVVDGGTSSGATNITNSTISQNSAFFSSSGGGVSNTSNTAVNVKSSIIALSTGGSGNRDVNGFFVSAGFNLVGKVDGSTGLTAPTDQTGTIASPLDPKLDPAGLQNNGGPTQTIALLPSSPAIDKGISSGLTGNLTTDQRGSGFPRTVDYPVATNATGGDGADVGALEFGGPLVPLSVSRKTHGAATFDVSLPLTGAAGIECRIGGASSSHQLIMNFPGPVTMMDASVASGVGSVGSFTVIGPTITVNLVNVNNAQTIVLTLLGVGNGTTASNVTIPIGLLLGDTNGNGLVNATDISETKAKSGQVLGVFNFRTDVTVSGAVNASDVSIVKSLAGTALP